MAFLLLGLSVVVGLVSLGCWIFTIVRGFQSGETALGVLSICPLAGFIIGWVNAGKWNHAVVMMVWTGCIIINLLLQVAAGALIQAQ